MQYKVKHSCGHEVTVSFYGTSKERERKLAWHASRPCTECANAQAAAANKAAGLPELSGTSDMVKWAERIRASRMAELDQLGAQIQAAAGTDAEKAPHMAAIAAVRSKADAAYWIDTRNEAVTRLVKAELRH